MPAARPGTSLCEVLVALVLLSATAGWAFRATLATARAGVEAERRRTQLHRAELALAELHAMPCDSINIVRAVPERNWSLSLLRDHDGLSHRDEVVLRARTGDTVRVQRTGWCD
jgi:hypothetical protein